jgi:hypothetical protein
VKKIVSSDISKLPGLSTHQKKPIRPSPPFVRPARSLPRPNPPRDEVKLPRDVSGISMEYWKIMGNTMGISWEYHTDWIFDDNQMTIMIGYLWLLNNQIIS